MIPDLRRKLVSALGADEDCTDAQLVTHAKHVTTVNATLWDLLSRSRTPVHKPWAAVGIGEYVLERGNSAIWTVVGRDPGQGEDTEIGFTMRDPGGGTKEFVRPRSGKAWTFELSPLANGAEVLAAELGAQLREPSRWAAGTKYAGEGS